MLNITYDTALGQYVLKVNLPDKLITKFPNGLMVMTKHGGLHIIRDNNISYVPSSKHLITVYNNLDTTFITSHSETHLLEIKAI